MADAKMVRRARELHARGLSWRKVGRRLGVSAATAWRWGTEASGDAPHGAGEAERVRRELENGRLRRLRVARDATGQGHQLGLVRIAGGLELVVDRPLEAGAVRCLAVLSAEEDEEQARAICADYARRIAAEERPICRVVRLGELLGVSEG